MNVIFLDFDGILNTVHLNSAEGVEERVKLLGEICKELNCKIVIESAMKDMINENTLETECEYVNNIYRLFKKYNIECIGRTPTVERETKDGIWYPIWKEDEIRLYLYRHPEIEHYCILDDDDFLDLKKVSKHLVKPIYWSYRADEEGLLPKHKEEIREILKKENLFRKYVLKRQKNN
jgi:hypothetical protein